MPDARLRDALPRARDIALLCAARGLAGVAAWASGFRALSDDDYARITIAQRFAASAHFDPSGTSWLPAPFWIYGGVFRCFGTSIGVARATAVGLSATATLLVYVAARWLGACRPGALVSAALCSLLPYSALLGIAAVPEVPCAALILLGAAALARADPESRALGALSLSVACLSRYEAWPVAGAFAAFNLCDALRQRRAVWVWCAAIALSGPALWLMLGSVEHGSALFFVTRVTAYRRAIGGPSEHASWQRLLEYPGLLVRAEPELAMLLLAVAALGRGVADPEKLRPYRRAGLALLASLAFLMLGSARDGTPTHHAARVLLPIWFYMCVLSGHGLAHLTAIGSPAARLRLYAVSGVAVFAGLLLRPKLIPAEGFAERQLELDAGRQARQRHADALAIDTPDYGYFAIQAGFGSPDQSSVLDDHDPRSPRTSDPFTSPAALEQALNDRHARFLLTTPEHAVVAAEACVELWKSQRFVLFRCPTAGATPSTP